MALKLIFAALAMALTAASPFGAVAQDVPVITVSSATETATFTRDELEAMNVVTVETTTPWNEGVVTFEGVLFTDLLAEINADGETTVVTALNDYSVDVPTADFAEFGTILAFKRNGEYMPVDDQGPFFVVYPFDSNPVLQGQPYYGRAVWQVKEITVH